MTELEAINRMLAGIGQAPVNTVDQANPDVAICSRTLKQVSQEVQSEGWTFNRVNNFMQQPSEGLLIIRSSTSDGDSDYIMQMDLSHNSLFSRDKQTCAKGRGAEICLYNLSDDTFDWGNNPIEVDKTYYYADIGVIPPASQNYIVSKASAAISFKTFGDPNLYKILRSQ